MSIEFELRDNSEDTVGCAIFEINEGDGFWYGLTNEYIKPELILKEGDMLNKVTEAIKVLSEFEEFILGLEGE
jgi:hypothetical protein